MPDHTKSSELSECEERERLLDDLDQAIRETIQTRDEAGARDALKFWRAARRAFMRHVEEHGC
jgi:hypothetical protein